MAANDCTDVVSKLEDLIKQATTERSHFYVAATAGQAVRELRSLRLAIFDTETPKIIPWAQLVKKAEREGIDIMDYVNGLHVHILNQRDEINRLKETLAVRDRENGALAEGCLAKLGIKPEDLR